MSEPTRCSSCQAPIVWAKHVKSRQRAPIDAAPAPEGNVELIAGTEEYRIVPKAERAALVGRLHLSHFVTCPTREQHRKPA